MNGTGTEQAEPRKAKVRRKKADGGTQPTTAEVEEKKREEAAQEESGRTWGKVVFAHAVDTEEGQRLWNIFEGPEDLGNSSQEAKKWLQGEIEGGHREKGDYRILRSVDEFTAEVRMVQQVLFK